MKTEKVATTPVGADPVRYLGGVPENSVVLSPMQVAIRNLSPGYFALVMGTGIISVGLYYVGIAELSIVLMFIAAAAYVTLWVLNVWRAIAFPEAMRADLKNPEVAFTFFTVVAGTSVLAVCLTQHGYGSIAVPLFVLAAVLWFVFGYILPWQVLMTRDGKPILARTNGTWFIWAVASQSLAVGMAQLQSHVSTGLEWIGILAVLSWSVGLALYVGSAVLVVLRIVHFGITPQEFEPPYWVSMGALAIAVVAGAGIVNMEQAPMVDATRTLISGTVVIFWAVCVWLIPMLLGAGFWRHVIHRVPFVYKPTLWSMVFPMGMFAAASISMGRADYLPIVENIGYWALGGAALAWVCVFIGMLWHIWRTVLKPSMPRA